MKVAIFGGSILPEDGYEFITVILEQFYEREKKGEVIEYLIPNDNNFIYELLIQYFTRNDIKTFKEYKQDWKKNGKNSNSIRLQEMTDLLGPGDIVINMIDSVAKEAGIPSKGINYLLNKAAEKKGFTIQTHFIPSDRDISSFLGVNSFLSNFYSSPVHVHGRPYQSAEAAFQGCKTLDLEDAERFTNLDPRQAKDYGHKVKLREDWEEVKEQMMYEVVKAKFLTIVTNKCLYDRTKLFRSLIATGDRKIIEGNHRHDNEWGHCYCKECMNIPKNNKLGKILMRVREELKSYDKNNIPFISTAHAKGSFLVLLLNIEESQAFATGDIKRIVLKNGFGSAGDIQDIILSGDNIIQKHTTYNYLEDGTPVMTTVMKLQGENESIETIVGDDITIGRSDTIHEEGDEVSICVRSENMTIFIRIEKDENIIDKLENTIKAFFHTRRVDADELNDVFENGERFTDPSGYDTVRNSLLEIKMKRGE